MINYYQVQVKSDRKVRFPSYIWSNINDEIWNSHHEAEGGIWQSHLSVLFSTVVNIKICNLHVYSVKNTNNFPTAMLMQYFIPSPSNAASFSQPLSLWHHVCEILSSKLPSAACRNLRGEPAGLCGCEVISEECSGSVLVTSQGDDDVLKFVLSCCTGSQSACLLLVLTASRGDLLK